MVGGERSSSSFRTEVACLYARLDAGTGAMNRSDILHKRSLDRKPLPSSKANLMPSTMASLDLLPFGLVCYLELHCICCYLRQYCQIKWNTIMDGLGLLFYVLPLTEMWHKETIIIRSQALHFIDANDDPLNHDCSVDDSRDCKGDCILTGMTARLRRLPS